MELGLLPFALLTLLAPDAFKLIFGTQWETAGIYVRWLALWIFLVFVSSPLSSVYMVLEKQRLGFFVNLVMLTTRVLALVIGGMSGSAMLTVQLFGATGLLLWIGNCLLILSMAGVSFSKILSGLRGPIFEALLFLAPVLVTLASVENSLGRICLGFACFAAFVFFKGYRFMKEGLPA
jgi:O-antigen/teichoic acid export membrane protein